MRALVANVFLLTSLWAPTGAKAQTGADLLRFLPGEAKLELAPVRTHLATGGPEQLVVFYTSPDPTSHVPWSQVAVLEPNDNELKRIWTLNCGGAYVGFFPDSGVYDFTHSGHPEIVVDCEGTTVCPNFFGIFEYRDGKILPIPADFKPLETCQVSLKDLDGEGVPEVINYPHLPFSLPEIYHWNGARFAKANAHYPHFWAEYGARNYATANSDSQPLPLQVMVDGCRTALEVFELARTPEKARLACIRAKERIASGVGVWKPPGVTNGKFEHQKEAAIVQIEAELARLAASRPSRK